MKNIFSVFLVLVLTSNLLGCVNAQTRAEESKKGTTDVSSTKEAAADWGSTEEETVADSIKETSDPANSGEPDFIVKETPVFRATLTDETVSLRFYEDQPNVPYMGISSYYAMMAPGTKMQVENKGDGIYLLTNETGSAIADVQKDTLSSDNIADFTDLMILVQEGMPNVYLDGAPYIRYEEAIYEPESVPVNFVFYDYHIDLHGDKEDVYFPLATLSDMFADLGYHYSSYNGVNIYVNDDTRLPKAPERDEHYYDSILTMGRPADLAAFSYWEACFAIDHFFGYTGLGYLERKADLSNAGLDKALESIGEAGTNTKRLLQSSDMAEYFAGRLRLHMLISDGAHTGLGIGSSDIENNTELVEKWKKMNDPELDGMKYFGDIMLLEDLEVQHPGEDIMAMSDLRDGLYGEGASYYSSGTTAVCILDSFDINYEGWEAYLTGEGELPSDDSFALVVDALNKAQADPDIRNFVLDLTFNGGGSVDVLMGIFSLWLDQSEYTCDNVREKQQRTIRYEIDRNLDGRIDEADADIKYDLQFAVLTSGVSFSCSNYCASLAEDNGIPVLGHRTAGGACSIVRYATPEGFIVQMSSDLCRLINRNGDVAEGVDPDIELSPIGENGSVDYTEMYDFEKIGKLMDEWYQR